jgi:hypothetical protein
LIHRGKTGRLAAVTLCAILALGIGFGVAAARDGAKLILNGKITSADVRTMNGSAYVRLSDVATALGMVVVKRSDGYELTKAGGANQVEGLNGKVGDTLFDGRWRFTVMGAETTNAYALKSTGEPYAYNQPVDFNSATRTLTPKPGNTLIVVRCRIANGQKSTQTLWLAQRDTHTALADDQGESYPPAAHDVDGAPIQTKPLLPGAKLEFPVIFVVPQGKKLQDLVFTLKNNDSAQKGNDVRVVLGTP